MELEDTKYSVLLCKKCFEKGDYLIPIYEKNEVTQKIGYKCSKNHKIDKNDIICKKIDENLKRKLTFCENHKENIFCAWSKDKAKNICFFEVGEHLTNKKDYELFMYIYPDIELNEDMYFKILDSLKQLLKEYLIGFPKAIKEINYLKEIVLINENNFYIFFREKIVNYQTIKNIYFSLEIMPSKEEIELLEKKLFLVVNEYGDNIYETTKKEIKNLVIKESNSDFKEGEKDIKIVSYIENKTKLLLAYYNNKKYSNIFIFEIIENNLVQRKKLEQEFNIQVAMVYNEKLIILLKNKELFFITFNENLTEYKTSSLNLDKYLLNMIIGNDDDHDNNNNYDDSNHDIDNIYDYNNDNNNHINDDINDDYDDNNNSQDDDLFQINHDHSNNNESLNENHFYGGLCGGTYNNTQFHDYLFDYNFYSYSFDYHFYSTSYENQVFKINKDKILLLYENNVYLMTLNEKLD